MRALAVVAVVLLASCASKPTSTVLGYRCFNGGVIVSVQVQTAELRTMRILVPDGVCEDQPAPIKPAGKES
jgi:hypothetical protein